MYYISKENALKISTPRNVIDVLRGFGFHPFRGKVDNGFFCFYNDNFEHLQFYF